MDLAVLHRLVCKALANMLGTLASADDVVRPFNACRVVLTAQCTDAGDSQLLGNYLSRHALSFCSGQSGFRLPYERGVCLNSVTYPVTERMFLEVAHDVA